MWRAFQCWLYTYNLTFLTTCHNNTNNANLWCGNITHTKNSFLIPHPWWWRQYAPLKRRSTIILHGSITKKTVLNNSFLKLYHNNTWPSWLKVSENLLLKLFRSLQFLAGAKRALRVRKICLSLFYNNGTNVPLLKGIVVQQWDPKLHSFAHQSLVTTLTQ
jgi:hypothetical protein